MTAHSHWRDWELILNQGSQTTVTPASGKKRKRIMNIAVDIKCIKIIKRLWKNIWIIFCCKTRGVMLGMERVFVANWFMFYVRQLGKHQGNLRSLINIFTMSPPQHPPTWPTSLWKRRKNMKFIQRAKCQCYLAIPIASKEQYSFIRQQ